MAYTSEGFARTTGWIPTSSRVARRLIALVASGLAFFGVACACEMRPLERVRVVDVEPGFVLRVADGHALRLVGLEAPDSWQARAREALRGWLADRDIEVESLGPLDRWNRLPVRARASVPGAAAGAPPLDLAPAILEAGLARALPGPETRGCFAPLAAAESSARAALLGLWADPYYAVIAARDRPGLVARPGQMVLVEGQARSVSELGQRTYVNFGERRAGDFSVMISGQTRKLFESAGHSLPALVGRGLRIRGILDTRFGPRIDVVDPDQIEFMQAGEAAGAGEHR